MKFEPNGAFRLTRPLIVSDELPGARKRLGALGGKQVVLTGAALIQMFHRFDPQNFAWRQPPYEYEHEKLPIDILAGSDVLRRQIESGTAPQAIAASWREDEEKFRRARAPYLLY